MNIEKNIEIPKRSESVHIPYEDFEVGDSYLAIGAKLQVVCNANYRASKRLGMQFIARKEPEGVRVWRVS